MLEEIGIKGIGSEGVIAIVIYLLIRFELWPWFKKRKYGQPENDRRKRTNPNDRPGNTRVCKENRDKIIAVETSFRDLKEENKEDHKEIKGDIKKLFNLWNKIKT